MLRLYIFVLLRDVRVMPKLNKYREFAKTRYG